MKQKPVLAGLRKPAHQEIRTYLQRKKSNYISGLLMLGMMLLGFVLMIMPMMLLGAFDIGERLRALGGIIASVWGMGAYVLHGIKKGYIGEKSPLGSLENGCCEVVRFTVCAKTERSFLNPEFILVGEDGMGYICISERTYLNARIGDSLYGVRIPNGSGFVPRQLTLAADEMLNVKKMAEIATVLHGIQGIPDDMPGLCLPQKVSLAKEPDPPKVILSKEYRPKISLKKEDT